jgi:hypothetical protein
MLGKKETTTASIVKHSIVAHGRAPCNLVRILFLAMSKSKHETTGLTPEPASRKLRTDDDKEVEKQEEDKPDHPMHADPMTRLVLEELQSEMAGYKNQTAYLMAQHSDTLREKAKREILVGGWSSFKPTFLRNGTSVYPKKHANPNIAVPLRSANNELQNTIRIVISLLYASLSYSTFLNSTLLNLYPTSTLPLPLPVPLLRFYAALLSSPLPLLYSTIFSSLPLLYLYAGVDWTQ